MLLVDDELDILKSVGMRLKSEGYNVLTASDGVAATQLALRELPDLIILDIGMPAGDGHTVMQRIKNNVKTAGIPVIFLTARSGEMDMERAGDAGAAGYVTKPFNSQYLMALVKKALFGVDLVPPES